MLLELEIPIRNSRSKEGEVSALRRSADFIHRGNPTDSIRFSGHMESPSFELVKGLEELFISSIHTTSTRLAQVLTIWTNA
jgi:hypothetical protein